MSAQIKKRTSTPVQKKPEYDGDIGTVISTGSTLLDLAISGGRVRGGGLPGGILVEIFGPSGSGKTVLLCEIAGAIQRKKGNIMFFDPEARLNKTFAQMFDLDPDEMDYTTPDTIPEMFKEVRKWEPGEAAINGIMADSLAALSTDMEMDNDDGDKMGMRRPKEFSEQLRKTARILVQKNLLMVCSNQIRDNLDAGPYGVKHKSPGGNAIGFYASLRLRTMGATKIKQKEKVAGKEVTRVVGITTTVEVFKSSVDKPYRTAPVTIIFDYGIDNIRENLVFIKKYTGASTYVLNGEKLAVSLEKAVAIVEEEGLEKELQEETIDVWEIIENKFKSDRKNKKR